MVIIFLVTFSCLLAYIVAQKVIRLGANELPVRFTAETSIKLSNGHSVRDAIPEETVDISRSLNTFVMIFDKDKSLIASSAMMGRDKPVYVKGALYYTDKISEYKVT